MKSVVSFSENTDYVSQEEEEEEEEEEDDDEEDEGDR